MRDVVRSERRPLSIDEIHGAARRRVASIGLRTVYRVVERLVADGELVPVAVPGRPDRYELAEVAARHHHHFHCVGCDRMFDVHGCPGRIDRMVPDGFVLEGHEITLSGWCDRCA